MLGLYQVLARKPLGRNEEELERFFAKKFIEYS